MKTLFVGGMIMLLISLTSASSQENAKPVDSLVNEINIPVSAESMNALNAAMVKMVSSQDLQDAIVNLIVKKIQQDSTKKVSVSMTSEGFLFESKDSGESFVAHVRKTSGEIHIVADASRGTSKTHLTMDVDAQGLVISGLEETPIKAGMFFMSISKEQTYMNFDNSAFIRVDAECGITIARASKFQNVPVTTEQITQLEGFLTYVATEILSQPEKMAKSLSSVGDIPNKDKGLLTAMAQLTHRVAGL